MLSDAEKDKKFEIFYKEQGYIEDNEGYKWLKDIFISGIDVSEKEINSLKAELEKASELIREELENRGIKFKNREDLWDKKAKEFLKKGR